MSRGVLVIFGGALVILGLVTIADPQRVHDRGGARRRYRDGELSDVGRIQVRGVGLFSLLTGVVLIVMGVV